MGFLTDKEVNRGRQPEIDCLKAFCIVPMILLHVFEECAEELGLAYDMLHVLEVLTGAAAFMMCMGLGSRYSRKQTVQHFVERGVGLLTVGQLLYLLRDAIPDLIAWWATGEERFLSASLLVFETDILTFAGLAFLLLALLKRLKLSDGAILGLGLGMNVAALLLFQVFQTTGSFLADQVLGLFVVTKAESYFPLCCYFLFVAFGHALGGVYLRIRDKDALANRVLTIGVPAVVAYYALRIAVPFPLYPEFFTTLQYVLKPLTDALANIAASLCFMALFHKLLARGSGEAPGFVRHLSRHINQYYCTSYVLATPVGTILMAARGEGMPGTAIPLLYGLFVVTACYFIIEWNEKHLHFGIMNLEGKRRVAVYTAVWLAPVAVFAYAYPQVHEYATFWTDYLMG